jgi:chromosome segregation ATPase
MSDENMKSLVGPSEAAVERELNRRRRLLRLLTGLLIIPLLAAAGFALFGRTDVEMVRKEVRSGVAPVESKLENLPDAKQLAVVQEQLSGTSKQIDRFKQSTSEEISSLKATTDQNALTIAQQGDKLTAGLKEVASQNAYAISDQGAKLAAVQNRQNDQETSLKALRDDLEKVKKEIASEGLTRSNIANLTGTISRQKVTISSLEETIQGLKQRVADLEQKCTSRDRPPGQ